MTAYGKLIAGVLFSEAAQLEQALEAFSEKANAIQRRSPSHTFGETDYYAEEMSAHLYRQFVSFAGLISLEEVIGWKKWAQAVEDRFRQAGKRQVNIDPGYVDLHKVVLLSAKSGGHKIYLGREVWADMVLIKKKGGYDSFAWTFPDLRGHKYEEWLLHVRSDFKKELKAF